MMAITNRMVTELTLTVCFAPLKLPTIPVTPITARTRTSTFMLIACPKKTGYSSEYTDCIVCFGCVTSPHAKHVDQRKVRIAIRRANK